MRSCAPGRRLGRDALLRVRACAFGVMWTCCPGRAGAHPYRTRGDRVTLMASLAEAPLSGALRILIFTRLVCMGRKEVWLVVILFVGTAFCLGACQSGKSAKTQITDPNAVFAQGGAHVETGGTPAHGGGRRGRGQFQGQNPGAPSDF
jgi:hypothetical protein